MTNTAACRINDNSSVAREAGIRLPRSACLPINRCNLPAAVLGGLTFQQHPTPLLLDGVAELHRLLFQLLEPLADPTERARQFMDYMTVYFRLEALEEVGLSLGRPKLRGRADYLRMVRGWAFDPDCREGAVLKGWVESRFGLLTRYHGGLLDDRTQEAYLHFQEARSHGLYSTNALEAQLDLLYTYCQYELHCSQPELTHLNLYRGFNRFSDDQVLAQLDRRRLVVLLLFLLASGDMFYEKLVRVLPTLTDRKRGLRIAYDIEREVSRYLLTITIINFALGAVIGAGLFVLGMPNPILWGLIAALLNFVPYIGAITGMAVVSVVAMVSFPTLGHALLAPAFYMFCSAIEGQFITPALVGRRLQINAIAVFLAIVFWGWIWGVIGVFVAVPMLIVVKVFCRHIESLSGLDEFLSARDNPVPDSDG